MLVFDKRSLRCVVPPTEDCEVPTTPAPGPDDLPDGDDEVENLPPGRGQQSQQSNQPQQGRQQAGQPTQQYLQAQRQQQLQQQQQQQQRQDDGNGGVHFNLPPGAVPLPARNNQRQQQ